MGSGISQAIKLSGKKVVVSHNQFPSPHSTNLSAMLQRVCPTKKKQQQQKVACFSDKLEHTKKKTNSEIRPVEVNLCKRYVHVHYHFPLRNVYN